MAVGVGWFDRMERAARIVFFVVVSVASLLVQCLPVLVAVGDVLVLWILVSYFACLRCHGLKEHFRRYSLNRSLVDIPVVSLVRSVIITGVYTICDGRAISYGPYFGIVTLCSISSIILLSIKTFVFSMNSHMEAEKSYTPSRRRLHIKNSWGMPVLFLSSVVFALGHMVIAYQTSYKARRKLMFHRVDPVVVFSSKSLLSSLQKVPRSPSPSVKAPNGDCELKKNLIGSKHKQGALPFRLLADVDSSFVTCNGYTLHYKLSMPSHPPDSSSSTTSSESNSRCSSPTGTGTTVPSKNQYTQHKSNEFQGSSLYDPLLDVSFSTTSVHLPDHSPVFNLDHVVGKGNFSTLNTFEIDLEANGQCGIVLVHGFGGGVFSWRHVMGTLARQVGCVVAAFDRPGWGLSPRPRRKEWEERELPNPYELETQVDLLLSFCMEMGFSSVILVGHDDGGVLVLKAAERLQRSRNSTKVFIKALVLLGVGLSRDVVPSFARILLRTSLAKKHLVHPLLRTEITQVVNRRAWYDATKLTTEILGLYKAPLCIEGWDDALLEITKLSCETALSPQAAATLLQAVKPLPILVVAGAEDKLVSLQSAQAMASTLVNSRLVAVSGCGHLPHEECPKALLAAIYPFISRLLMDSCLRDRCR